MALVAHQTQPTRGHAANKRLMATLMRLAKPVDVADSCLNALFKNAPEPQNGAFPMPSDPGLELDKLEPRIKPL